MAFWINVGSVAAQVAQLFLLMGAGLLCGKIGWVNDTGAKQMTNVLFRVVTFCVIVESFLSVENSPENRQHMLIAAGVCAACCLLGALLVLPLYRGAPENRRGVLRFGTVFSNCGFMALPLVDALVGAHGVFMVSIYVAVFQIIIWTYGVGLYGYFDKKNAIRQILTNPGIISVAVGLPLFLLRVSCPAVILNPVSMLADLNTPVAMLITGFYLGQMKLRLQTGDGSILLAVFLRLAVIPALMLAGMLAVGLRGPVLVACVIPACAPTASNTALFAVMFGADQVYASRMVSFCTLASILTMPVLIAAAQSFGG